MAELIIAAAGEAVDAALGTPPIPVAVARYAPGGAASEVSVDAAMRFGQWKMKSDRNMGEGEGGGNVPAKRPPAASAASTATLRRSPASDGTVESRPTRGGS